MKPSKAPLRVDFAGGWLDVPAYAIEGAYIVNCAIQPLVSLDWWPYERNAGLGGSAAYSVLQGLDAVETELEFTGWQDPAVILETGLCIWRSGPRPVLETKVNPDWLNGLMALWHSGKPHKTADLLTRPRNYHALARASHIAAQGVLKGNLTLLAEAINQTHNAQLEEGMAPIPSALKSLAYKYAGSGHGGYVLYLFASREDRDRFCASGGIPIEPYLARGQSPPVEGPMDLKSCL